MTMCFFRKKATTLKTLKNQTNYKQLQKQKTKSLVRSLDSIYNPQKTIEAGDHKNGKPKGGKNEKSIFVTGNSIVKHLNEWEMSKKLNANCKVFVKTFSSGKTTCMNDYVKPSVRSSADHFILHVGTNDLSSNKSPEEIAGSIIDLATLTRKTVQGEELLPY